MIPKFKKKSRTKQGTPYAFTVTKMALTAAVQKVLLLYTKRQDAGGNWAPTHILVWAGYRKP